MVDNGLMSVGYWEKNTIRTFLFKTQRMSFKKSRGKVYETLFSLKVNRHKCKGAFTPNLMPCGKCRIHFRDSLQRSLPAATTFTAAGLKVQSASRCGGQSHMSVI